MMSHWGVVLLVLTLVIGCNSNSAGTDQDVVFAATWLSGGYSAESPRNASERWYEDNNLGRSGGAPHDFLSRLSDPDNWHTSRDVMHVFYLRSATYRDHLQGNDAALAEMATLFAQHNIALAIDETAATWANASHRNVDLTYQSSIDMLEALTAAGFDLRYVSLQSVISKPLKNAQGEVVEYSDELRFKDVLSYIEAIKPRFPQLEIGIIDALPARVSRDVYQQTYSNLLLYLNQSNQVLDYLHLDLPINVIESQANNLSYASVLEIQNYVQDSLGLRFGVFVTDRLGGITSSNEFSSRVLMGIDSLVQAGVSPDEYVLAAWFPFPDYSAPDEAAFVSSTQLSLFRALDQRLNYWGDINDKHCIYDVMRIEDSGVVDYEFMGYNLSSGEKEKSFRTACFSDAGLKPLFHCSSNNSAAFITDEESCEGNTELTSRLVGYVYANDTHNTSPIYQCVQDERTIVTNSSAECVNATSVVMLGYSY